MIRGAAAVRSLHLELRAHRVEVQVKPTPKGTGGVMNYGIVMDRLHILSATHASSVARHILDNKSHLVQLLVNERISISTQFARKATVGNGGPAACV